MNGDEILDVLKQIRDEARQTNTQLVSLEGRVKFVEKRLSKGFEELSGRIDSLGQRQAEGEAHLSYEILSLADVTRQVRDLFATKLDDHRMVVDHEERIRSIESRIADRPTE